MLNVVRILVFSEDGAHAQTSEWVPAGSGHLVPQSKSSVFSVSLLVVKWTALSDVRAAHYFTKSIQPWLVGVFKTELGGFWRAFSHPAKHHHPGPQRPVEMVCQLIKMQWNFTRVWGQRSDSSRCSFFIGAVFGWVGIEEYWPGSKVNFTDTLWKGHHARRWVTFAKTAASTRACIHARSMWMWKGLRCCKPPKVMSFCLKLCVL